MSFQMIADLLGNTDHSSDTLCESIYLLREDYRVIGIRRSDYTSKYMPQLGDNFFECYPAEPSEMRTLAGMTTHANRHSLLMRAGKRPVVILFALFPTTRLLVAIVPDAPTRNTLNFPAAYAELLQEFYLFLSPVSASRRRPLQESAVNVIYPWAQRIYQALFYDRIHPLEPGAELLRAIMRLRYVSDLCGCAVDYDFTGIAHAVKEEQTLDRLIGTALVLFVTVRAVSPDRHVRLIAGDVYGCGPMAAAVFTCDRPTEELTALQHLAKEATLRGERFDVVRHPDDPHRVMVQFALCHKEISEQGIKHPLPDEFSQTDISLPFFIPENSNSN